MNLRNRIIASALVFLFAVFVTSATALMACEKSGQKDCKAKCAETCKHDGKTECKAECKDKCRAECKDKCKAECKDKCKCECKDKCKGGHAGQSSKAGLGHGDSCPMHASASCVSAGPGATAAADTKAKDSDPGRK
ncbi:MAG: hypothetical protein AB1792_00700 [Candidatus Zixiibacteriota bacterium]